MLTLRVFQQSYREAIQHREEETTSLTAAEWLYVMPLPTVTYTTAALLLYLIWATLLYFVVDVAVFLFALAGTAFTVVGLFLGLKQVIGG
jgi:hypothetical protein